MGITYTKNQQTVIDLHHKNILVSAAAGSGKTAVLVERIVQMVSNPSEPVDIDRLLIVTFTNAAAAEMRERISNALLKKMEEEPDNEHLQKQVTLIHNAQITTIDSFCLFVIRNNFNDIGLDPGFRVADEGELKLLKEDVLAQVLESNFEKKEDAFFHLVECYSPGGKEKALEEHIQKLYQFSMSYPWPQQWLLKCQEDYNIHTIEELEQAEWIKKSVELIQLMLKDSIYKLEMALEICQAPDGPYMYENTLLREKEMLLCAVVNESTFQQEYESIGALSFDRLPSKKDDSVSGDKREMVKEIRNEIKKNIGTIKSNYFFQTIQASMEDLMASTQTVGQLIQITLEFMIEFAKQKRDKNIIDFSDMEHFALEILLEESAGEIKPKKAALSYQDYFKEILTDEYQDSNLVQEYLLKSISREGQGEYNRFMVGDVKQSIYKFRLARPELFMEKYNTYDREPSGGSNQRIDLRQNFRSREEVIESVNYIFYQIMTESLGGVTYDKSAALYLGAEYPDWQQDNRTELLLVEKGLEDTKEDKKNDKQLEAMAIAQRIKELVGTFFVMDKATNIKRTAEYGDIVILLRSNAGFDEEFRKVLVEEGIPTHTTSKTGYFSSLEIQLLLNYLRILDNPLQDIPLCGVLSSQVIGFHNEELAHIKSTARESNKKTKAMYESLLFYKDNGSKPELVKKIYLFLEPLEQYRKMVPFTPIQELIRKFSTELGFYHYMSAMPGGEQRRANMDMLLEKAIQFEQTSYHGLFHFVRYIEHMEKYDVDFGEANTLDEFANVVRIMSIHKSKGLEFPICIVAGMSKGFNMMDARQSLIMDMDYGIGTDYIDPVNRYKIPTLRKNAIATKMKLENIGEELRILYVALTRAKEKLIMTGVVEDVEKLVRKHYEIIYHTSESISFSELFGMNCYMDFIVKSLMRHRSFKPLLESISLESNGKNPMFDLGPELQILRVNAETMVVSKVKEQLEKDYLKTKLESHQYEAEVDVELEAELEERFSFQYQHEILSKLYTKTTVSELKRMGKPQGEDFGVLLHEEVEVVPYIPGFIEKTEEVSGSTRGSAYHRVLELLSFQNLKEERDIIAQMEALVEKGTLSRQYLEAVNVTKIMEFVLSPLAKRMELAEEKNVLFKEQPFVLGVPANQIEVDFPKEETILVQGIIDVFFEEENELILVDYKTDRVTNGEELWMRYQTQLDYYADALERLTNKKVKEKIIYSFALGKEFTDFHSLH